ncbi:MAG: GMC oxidoreductase [Prochlorococcus sp.]
MSEPGTTDTKVDTKANINADTYEAIVIGSGATGGVAALTLAEAGVRVLVVEAGPHWSAQQALGSEPVNSLRRLAGLSSGQHRRQAQHPGYWKANPLLYADERRHPYSHPQDQPFLWTQGRQVGGRSLTWGGITLRLSDDEFSAASSDGLGSGWPLTHAELAPHYSALEKSLQVHGHCDGLQQLPDGHYQEPYAFTAAEQCFAEAVQDNLGHRLIHSRGFGPHRPAEDGAWPLYSSPGSTLARAIATGRVDVLSEHMAERLVMSADRRSAEAVIVVDQRNGSRHQLHGSLIVLCASTIQSLRLLLNSEVGQHGDGFVDPSGILGCHLMDHVSICRFFAFPRQLFSASETREKAAPLSGAGSFFFPFGRHFNNNQSPGFSGGYGLWGGIDRFDPPAAFKKYPDSVTGFLIGHGEVLPDRRNRVTLSAQTDPWGIPIPQISCCWRANELAMVKHMQRTIAEIVASAGGTIQPFKDLFRLPFLEKFLQGAVALGEAAPPPGYYVHEVGGAPMGDAESISVVNRFNQLWRCRNVLVVDGACWPTSGWQSPTLTMMAITRRACLQALRRNDGGTDR